MSDGRGFASRFPNASAEFSGRELAYLTSVQSGRRASALLRITDSRRTSCEVLKVPGGDIRSEEDAN
jgi:hypothetical protein